MGKPIDGIPTVSYVVAMSKLEILTIPDKILLLPADPVERVDDALRTLLDDMIETMYAAPGIGLAAPQVGVLKRAVTIDVARRKEDDDPQAEVPREPLFLINPEIVWSSEVPSVYTEGCLSIPEYYAEIERPAEVIVQFLDRDGKECELKADGVLATCIQHEVDHLDGILFIDYLSKLKRDRVIKKFVKMKKTLAY